MNLAAELDLPVVIHDGVYRTLRQVIDATPTHLNIDSPKPPASVGRLQAAHDRVAHYGPEEIRELAVARLAGCPGATFRLLDGRSFTPAAVIAEIEAGTPTGIYFANLKRSATLVALKAAIAQESKKRPPT